MAHDSKVDEHIPQSGTLETNIKTKPIIPSPHSESADTISTKGYKLREIQQLIDENVTNEAKLKADTKRINDEIEATFSGYIELLTQRVVELKKRLSDESKQQSDALLQQRQQLQNIKESVANGLGDINAFKDKDQAAIQLKLSGIEFFHNDQSVSEVRSLRLFPYFSDSPKLQNSIIYFVDDQFVSSIGLISGRPTAPILNVSSKMTTRAVVTLKSGHHKDDIMYSLRYRKERQVGDQTYFPHWKDLTLPAGTNQHILRGLDQDCRYQIQGSCQVRFQIATRTYATTFDCP